jgi:hypothetical protein
VDPEAAFHTPISPESVETGAIMPSDGTGIGIGTGAHGAAITAASISRYGSPVSRSAIIAATTRLDAATHHRSAIITTTARRMSIVIA